MPLASVADIANVQTLPPSTSVHKPSSELEISLVTNLTDLTEVNQYLSH